MKIQTILSLAMATVALFASCSSDEILDVPVDKTIQFSGAFVDNSTRAATDPSYTTSTLDKFNVYGWVSQTANGTTTTGQIFNEVEVSKSSEKWAYGENYIQYWVADGSYTFDAIAGANGTIDIKDDAKGEHASTPTITSFDASQQTDLIYATATVTGKASGNSTVNFTFKHQLAKVKFSFLNSTAGDIDAKITGITIKSAAQKGDVTLSAGTTSATWSTSSDTYDLPVGDALTETSGYITKTSGSYTESANEKFLIPTTASYTVEFTTDIYQKDVLIKTVTHKATIPSTEFKGGYAYNFTAELTASNIDPSSSLEPIEFGLEEVTAWVDQTSTALTIPETEEVKADDDNQD
jgi:hypothetical protein